MRGIQTFRKGENERSIYVHRTFYVMQTFLKQLGFATVLMCMSNF